MRKILIAILMILHFTGLEASEYPNILLIIADDMGADLMPGYGIGTNIPNTPHLDELRQSGLTFTNVWAAPVCSASRASLMTGKYGVNNGVPSVPGILSTDHTSIFRRLKQQTDNVYTTCLVGKWHLGKNRDYDHPNEHGVDEFMGVMEAGVSDYYKWNKVENQSPDTCSEYATTYFTDFAIDWIREQSQPWLMWLAHVSPHDPYHYPPEGTFTHGKEGSPNMKKYLSMIENLDHEIGRLLDSIPADVLENTIIIFVGDNGTPTNLLQGYSIGKGSLYQGGIHVPMLISGKGVSRRNEIEDAQINICDLYATIAHMSDESIGEKGGLYNSLSFKHLLSGAEGSTRKYNYMELGEKNAFPNDAFTIRDEQYKMIQYVDSVQEFYDLLNDPFESNDLLKGTLNSIQQNALGILEQEAITIRTGWSCHDGIQNGSETDIDCGGPCEECQATGVSDPEYSDKTIVYPNPFNDQLLIENTGRSSDARLLLYNSIGQKVNTVNRIEGNTIYISTRGYLPGLYFLSIEDYQSKQTKIYKLIKK